MRRRSISPRPLWLAGTYVFVGAVLVACGGKGDPSSSSATATAKASAKPSASASAAVSATLTPQKDPITHEQPFTVEWTGPNNPDDYIDVVDSGRPLQVGDEHSYARTSAGHPAKLNAPPRAGTYDVRYVQDHDGKTVIAHVSITVN